MTNIQTYSTSNPYYATFFTRDTNGLNPWFSGKITWHFCAVTYV
jgi:hypothetical protein